MTEIQILSAIKNHDGSMEFTELLNLNMTDANRDPIADRSRIEQMIKDKLLEGKADANCVISISDKGRLHLQNSYYLEEQNKKFAEDTAKSKAKKNRHDWYLAIGSAIIAGLIGLLFELIAFFFLS